MPKISKVRKRSTVPGKPAQTDDRLGGYTCCRCGKTFKRQKGNFPASQSPLYKGNNSYLPMCSTCVDALYEHYREVLGSNEEAMRRMCLKFDMYWSRELYSIMAKANTSNSRVKAYISKSYLLRFAGKTYDDTLDEEHIGGRVVSALDIEGTEDLEPDEVVGVSPETVLFWGGGFTEDFYRDLELRYQRWTQDVPKPLTPAQEALYKQVCLQEISINRKIATGQNIEQGQNALNNLLGSLNEKPRQQSGQDDASADLETTPLGVWARRWEEDRPIPEYEEAEDKPNLIKYITTWFYGHAAKSLGLRNMYSRVYEEEMDKYRVAKPEFEGEDDDLVISEIVSDANDP